MSQTQTSTDGQERLRRHSFNIKSWGNTFRSSPCLQPSVQPQHLVPFTWHQWPLWGLFVLRISLRTLQFFLPSSLSPLFDGGLHCFATLAVNLGIQPLFFVAALVLLLLPLLPAIQSPLSKSEGFLCLVVLPHLKHIGLTQINNCLSVPFVYSANFFLAFLCVFAWKKISVSWGSSSQGYKEGEAL